MPEGSSGDSAEPPPGGEPTFSRRRDSRPIAYRRYPAAWAAAGLVLLGGSAAIIATHESGGHPSTQTAFCGLVECSVLHSAAAAASEPSGNPRPVPFPSSPLTPPRTAPAAAPTLGPRPGPTTPAPSPAPVSAPAPAVTAPAAPPAPARTPEPVPTWKPPAPRSPWPPRWTPPPWLPAGPGWSHHSPWWQGQRSHQPAWW